MIELDETDVRLIQRIQKDNCTDYEILEIKDRYFIDKDNLLSALDDTQDNREYAEDKLKDYIEEAETRKEEEIPGLLKSYQKECEKLKEEKEELIKTIKSIQNTLDEDDYDKLAEEGIEIYERD